MINFVDKQKSGYSMIKKLITILLTCAAILHAHGETVVIDGVPRDTSFTFHSTALKVRKTYPDVKLVTVNPDDSLRAIEDVVYYRPDGRRELHVDLYRPASDSILPAVLMIHGGGWNSGDRTLQRPLARALAAQGFVTIPVEYRLTPEAPYPAGLHDVKRAVQWVRSHAARYGIDPSRIAVSGCSAGGQLAALVGVTNGSRRHAPADVNADSAMVQAVVNIDGIVTFVSEYNLDDVARRYAQKGVKPVNAQWLGGLPEEAPENWREASSLLWITDNSAPVCFINSRLPRYHDGRDILVAEYHRRQIPVAVISLDSNIHPFWFFDRWFTPTVTAAAAFLQSIFSSK